MDNAPGDPGAHEAAAPLDLRHVSARYRGSPTRALSDVTLRMEGKEITALLGANGAGKSTLLKVAAGLLPVLDGVVSIEGREARTLSPRTLASLVAFVPQSESAPPGFSVRDVVAMGRAPHQGAWMRMGERDHVALEAALRRCDLAMLADRPADTLSGGEQRRVAIARALAQSPRVLLLDEPAAFLDVRHCLELYELLVEVVTRDGIACVVTMHDLDAASRFASKVVLLRRGSVAAWGTPAEVLTPGYLSSVLDAEVDIGVHAPSGQRYFVARRSVRAL